MKLSELKPCASCGGPLLRPGIANWYVVRVSQALLHPGAAREVLGLNVYFGGALGIAEVMAPRADQAVAIIGDQPGAAWTELHLCFDCYARKGSIDLASLVEVKEATS
jgi:hypothetical protein